MNIHKHIVNYHTVFMKYDTLLQKIPTMTHFFPISNFYQIRIVFVISSNFSSVLYPEPIRKKY